MDSGRGDDESAASSAGWRARHGPLLALLVLALVLRCLYLNRSLWLDEGLSLEQAFTLAGKDAQQPLYFLFLALWTRLGGSAI
ncbi:MAG TPA: hypothetical protein VLA14_08750, partial [Polyangia bacterium]|nr:hypothetical protein [Polyangia bacterium]